MLEAWQAMQGLVTHTDVASIAGGLFYGGIVEEILLRWGVMTLLAWAGWRVLQHGKGTPRPAIIWTASIIAALLFGAVRLSLTVV
jgi:membrane protease YdiL (CAAX protease family)